MKFLGYALPLMLAFGLVGCKKDSVQVPGVRVAKAEAKKKKKKKKLYKIVPQKLELKDSKGKAAFQIRLVTGAKVHPQAPFKCKLTPKKGLTVAKNKLGHKDKVIDKKNKRKVSVGVDVAATGKGKQAVDFKCSFFVCTKEICVRMKEKFTIAAAAPAKKPAPVKKPEPRKTK